MVSGFLPTLFSLKLQNLQAQNQRTIHQLHKGGEFLITAAAVLCDGGLQGGQGDPQGAPSDHGDLLKEKPWENTAILQVFDILIGTYLIYSYLSGVTYVYLLCAKSEAINHPQFYRKGVVNDHP